MSPAPAFTHTGQRFADEFEGPLEVDAANGYAFSWLLAVLAGAFDTVADLSRDDEGVPGYAGLFDPDTVPADLLPFLGQFVGVEMLPGLTEAQQRLRIKQTDGFRRGTPKALEGAARQFLVGPDGTGETATVYIIERVGGNAYQFSVATLVSETPDAAEVLRALLEQKPAGLVMDYATITGGDWETLRTTHTDWADVKATFATWAGVRADPSIT
jgi:hypothetical protein